MGRFTKVVEQIHRHFGQQVHQMRKRASEVGDTNTVKAIDSLLSRLPRDTPRHLRTLWEACGLAFIAELADNDIGTVGEDPRAEATIKCKPGCHGCCSPNVAISNTEARVIASNISQQQITDLLAYAARHPESSDVEFESTYSYQDPDIPWCPFLTPGETGHRTCGIYAFRPVMCRMEAAYTPARWCYPRHHRPSLSSYPEDWPWHEMHDREDRVCKPMPEAFTFLIASIGDDLREDGYDPTLPGAGRSTIMPFKVIKALKASGRIP